MREYDVQSEIIKRVGYDVEQELLRVTFLGSGGTYDYFKVPADVAGRVIFGKSVGSTFIKLVKNGGYEYKKLVRTIA
jgi:hypothetical protein